MGHTNCEHLKKLLVFLHNEIIHEPGNKWFVDELYKMLSLKVTPSNATEEGIRKIESYLGLDYRIDKTTPEIDYSFIGNEYLRDCFEAEYREMMRCFFGLRNHRRDFEEFCRFALMQSERLLNIYYSSAYEDDIEKIKDRIREYADWATLTDRMKTVEDIGFAVKIDAFIKEFAISKAVKITFDRIREIRNTKSHGSHIPDTNEEFFQKHYAELINQGYPLTSYGLVSWAELEKNPQLNNIYHNYKKNTKEHQLYIKLSWQLRQKPFDEVLFALRQLINSIKNQLQD